MEENFLLKLYSQHLLEIDKFNIEMWNSFLQLLDIDLKTIMNNNQANQEAIIKPMEIIKLLSSQEKISPFKLRQIEFFIKNKQELTKFLSIYENQTQKLMIQRENTNANKQISANKNPTDECIDKQQIVDNNSNPIEKLPQFEEKKMVIQEEILNNQNMLLDTKFIQQFESTSYQIEEINNLNKKTKQIKDDNTKLKQELKEQIQKNKQKNAKINIQHIKQSALHISDTSSIAYSQLQQSNLNESSFYCIENPSDKKLKQEESKWQPEKQVDTCQTKNKQQFLIKMEKQPNLDKSQIKKFDKYDLQINFDDLLQIKEGIEILENILYSQGDLQLIGTLGKFKTGKTFLISKLTNQYYQQGLDQKTRGVCVSFNRKNNGNSQIKYYFFDIYGSGEPLQSYKLVNYKQQLIQLLVKKRQSQQLSELENQQIQELLQKIQSKEPQTDEDIENFYTQIDSEKEIIQNCYQEEENRQLLSETFIQHFIIEQTRVIFMVVGILSSSDQKLIEKLTQKVRSNYQTKKRLIVIHNYQNVDNVVDLRYYIQKDIINAFKVKQIQTKYEPEYDFSLSLYTNEDSTVLHGILARDESKLGEIVNKYLFSQIDANIKNDFQSSKVKVYDLFLQYLNQNLSKYLQIERENSIINPKQHIDFEISNNKKIESKWLKESKSVVSKVMIQNDSQEFMDIDMQNNESIPYQILKYQSQYIVKLEIVGLINEMLELQLVQNNQNNCYNLQVAGKRKNLYGENIEISQVIPLCSKGSSVNINGAKQTYKECILTISIATIE